MSKEEFVYQEIDVDEAGTRIDKFCQKILPDFTRTRIQQLIKEEALTVNNKPVKNSYKLKVEDKLKLIIPELKPLELEAENIPLDIQYEDENMLVINKPFGMLTHPTTIEKEHTLVNALLYHCKSSLSGINGVMRPGILHRLDRDTSGLLMIAKNDFAHQFLANQIKEKTAKRQYLTIVHGNIKEDEGIIDKPIDRHQSQRHKMGVVQGGKRAVTHWKVLERFKDFTYLEMTLDTGRTHQIRVHLSNKGHPVVGDTLYGAKDIKINTTKQVLQAYRLTFTIPGNNNIKTIEILPDDDITKVLKVLKLRSAQE